jgi:hypothetical protein
VQLASAQEPVASAGCESKQKSGGENEQTRFFAGMLPSVKQALTGALTAFEFKVDKDKADLIEGHRPHHVGVVTGSGGEKIVLHFKETEQEGKKGVQVTAETVKTMVGRLGQKSWTNAVLDQISCNLAKTAGAL